MADLFEGYTPPSSLSVKHLEVKLGISDEGGGEFSYNISYRYPIIDENGDTVVIRQGNGQGHCTEAEIAALKSFMDSKLTMVNAPLIP